MKYDLEERTAKFSEEIIELCKKVPKGILTIPIIDQLIRSGTSIGANYVEANGFTQECRKHWQEAQELTLIFSKITQSTK